MKQNKKYFLLGAGAVLAIEMAVAGIMQINKICKAMRDFCIVMDDDECVFDSMAECYLCDEKNCKKNTKESDI